MLKRKIYGLLKEWKGREHKSLIIKGQRQVGKTFIIEHFAKSEYEHYVKFDFSKDRKIFAAFSGNLDVDTLINNLRIIGHVDIHEGDLIFFDEIQDCPEAITSLKFFTVDGRYDVIATGSLLGVENFHLGNDRHPLTPLGYVEVKTMFPLDFEEFLWATGIGIDMTESIRMDVARMRPFSIAFLQELTTCFRDFMIVGGMPESVASFVKDRDYSKSFAILDNILMMCKNDMNRYNNGIDIQRTSHCFDSIPRQLSEVNKKFTFTRIASGKGRKAFDTYAENLLWIEYAGYGNFCRLLNSPSAPLAGHSLIDSFKVYMSDTGLLMRMYGDEAEEAIITGNTSYNNGAIAENVVADAIRKSGFTPYSYRKTNGSDKMELDFVIEMDGGVAVIEVKWSKAKRAVSLTKASKKFEIVRKIIFEDGNISVDADGIEHYPLFASAFLDSMRQS